MEKKDKIDLDLDFLDKADTKTGTNLGRNENKRIKEAKLKILKYFRLSDGIKKWLAGFAIIFVIGLIGAFNDNDSNSTNSISNSSTTTINDDGLVQTGEYRCSQFHHDRAGELEPSIAEGTALKEEETQLSAVGERIDSEKYEIEGEYVNEYSQMSIDQHNAKVDDYNSRLKIYQTRANMHDTNIDNYNIKVEVYNNYLIANCIRAY